MATSPTRTDGALPESKTDGVRLKRGSVGLIGVLFMALANAAPVTAMGGNVPIGIGFGNGAGMPGSFLFATVVLTLFTIGYVSMARYVTTAGAFLGFISHGLGQLWGVAAGYVATMAYVIFEASLVGILAWFGQGTLHAWFGITVNWLVLGIIGIVIVAVLGYFDLNIAAKMLGFFLVCEVLLLGALGLSILFHGGGPDGLELAALNPVNGFKGLAAGGNNPGSSASLNIHGIGAGAAAIGIFFAFWSWVGFETTAVYAEESTNPKRNIPRATLIAVIGLGAFYTFMSWMAVSGNGVREAIALSAGSNPIDLFQGLFGKYLGAWSVHVFEFLTVSSSFACTMAFHNAASRYLFAFGRESKKLRTSLGTAHLKHGSPHIASVVQSVITLVVTVLFYVIEGSDATHAAYVYQYGILAVIGTMALLGVQALCTVAVISYFWVKKTHTGNPITTLIIPILALAGMCYAQYLLFSNLAFAGGASSGSALFKAGPYLVVGVFLLGLAHALYARHRDPTHYLTLGRTVLEDSHERQ